MAQKNDPLRGLNPNQSGPIEKIQNGDPRAGKNRDQRSGGREAGGPGHSLQTEATGDGQPVPPHDDLEKTVGQTSRLGDVPGVSGTPEPAGSLDGAGSSPTLGSPGPA